MIKRDKLDRYYTPYFLTEKLLEKLEEKKIIINGTIFEPCCGKGFISNILLEKNYNVLTNDIDENVEANFHFDASEKCILSDWIITNPPFNLATKMIPLFYEKAKEGIICLLRLSYLEPCQNRREFLSKNPPDYVFVNKRVSFTNDGKSDSCTTAWIVWKKNKDSNNNIDFIF